MLTIPSEIKELLHRDSCQKNIRIHFPNGERSDICNDMIIKDSVKLTESLCSQETLKFGLCESPVFECSVVGMENMKGATIEVFNEVYCEPSVEGAVFRVDIQAYVYPIPYGTFVISECKRDADMQYRKITAYGPCINDESFLDTRALTLATKTGNTAYVYNIPYDPNILFAMLASVNPDASIIPIEYWEDAEPAEEFISVYSYSGLTEETFSYGFKCLRYTDGYENDNLYLRDMGNTPMLKTLDECIEEAGILNVEAIEHIKKSRLYKEVNNIKRQKFTYWYLGEIDSPDGEYIMHHGDYEDEYAYCPYALGYQVWAFGRLQREQVVQFRDYSSDKIYKITQTPFPAIKVSFPRELTSFGRYVVKKDSIDWGKYFEAYVELTGSFGMFKHNGRFNMLNIKKNFSQTPSSDLYPGSSTFPMGATGGKLLPNDYQSVWYGDEYTKPFGKIYVPYKNTSNVDVIFEYYLTGYDETSDINSYQTYDLSSNEIIKASTWTEERIEEICERIASNIEGVAYMPVEFTGRGLPYVEAGDTFEILTRSNDSITTIVLNRTLSGEQVLTDTYKSN